MGDLRSYRYAPLTGLDIRLIHILPQSNTRSKLDIECEIVHEDLENSSPYEALSYTWGSTDLVDNLTIITSSGASRSSAKLALTANCKAALIALRSNDITKIWIDAICINQGDIDERNRQVLRMREIYKRATRVVVFLGDALVDEMRWFYEFNELPLSALNSHPLPPQLIDPSWNKTSFEKTVMFLEELIARPWFNRIWILQEIASAKSAAVLFSNVGLKDWNTLVQYLKASDASRKNYGAQITQALPLILELQDKEVSEKFGLLELLLETRHADATDDRDKVYALLGIVNDASKITLRPNYRADLATVYTDTAKILIEASNCLDVLSGVQRASTIPGMPSWVPDFSIKPRRAVLGYPKSTTRDSGYSASESQPFGGWFEQISDNPLRLRAHGKTAGRVKLLSDQYIGPPQPELWSEFIAKLFHEATFAWLFGRDYTTILNLQLLSPGRMLDTQARTFIADITLDGHAAMQGCLTKETNDSERIFHPEARFIAWKSRLFDIRERDIFEEQIHRVCTGRRLAVTDKLHLALVPDNTEVGDDICVLQGANVPFVLRPQDQGDVFTLIGECYCHGIMKGEMVRELGFPDWRMVCIV